MDDDFQRLINRFKDFPVIERKPSFLEIAGFPHWETVWRNIFAFFFNPNECHGFKDLFIRSLFDALGKTEQGTGDFATIKISTECQTPKGNFLDLLIHCHEFAIGIEMKVKAPLYNDLVDYGKLVKAKSPDDEYKVVLSKAPCQAYGGFKNLRYDELIPAIKLQLGNYVLAADPKYTSFLTDFLNHVTRYIGGYAMNIDPKQHQFMKDNHKTVQRMIKTHNELQSLLEERMALVNDSVVVLDSLEKHVIERKRLFSYQGGRLSKILLKAGPVRFWYQLNITGDYCNGTQFWIDQKQREYQSFNNELKAEGFTSVKFDLSMPIEEVTSAVEKSLLGMIGFLSQKESLVQ